MDCGHDIYYSCYTDSDVSVEFDVEDTVETYNETFRERGVHSGWMKNIFFWLVECRDCVCCLLIECRDSICLLRNRRNRQEEVFMELSEPLL